MTSDKTEGKKSFKIAISGKGGVGKSTLSGMFCHFAAMEEYRVLGIDADPDANLGAALGMSPEEISKIIPLSARRALIEERTGAKVKQYGQVFKLNPDVADIAEKESAQFRSIHLLTLGAVESGGSGCACPENVMLKALLMDVLLYKNDCVIIDMEAGLEHLGRATAQGVDLMLIVTEPGGKAVNTVGNVLKMAEEIGIAKTAVVGNKSMGDEDRAFLEKSFPETNYLGTLPFSATVRKSDQENLPLIDVCEPELLAEYKNIWENALELIKG